MKRLHFLRYVIVLAVVFAVAVACSGGSDSPLVPGDNHDSTQTGGRIALGVPVIDGDLLTVTCEFSEAVDLYAMSFRIGFDPESLDFEDIIWGGMVGEEDAVFCNRNQHNFVPLAFARYSGMPGLEGHGTLATLRFRIKQQEQKDPWIIRDRNFLRARDSIGNELRLEVGGDS